MTLGIKTFSITIKTGQPAQRDKILTAVMLHLDYAECRCLCRISFIVMMSGIMFSVIMLSVAAPECVLAIKKHLEQKLFF